MNASRPRPWWERVALELLRWVLWPIAQIRPLSGWARLHDRLYHLNNSNRDPAGPDKPRKREPRVTPHMALFALLISAAAAIWIYDVIRRPPPEPARIEHTSPR